MSPDAGSGFFVPVSTPSHHLIRLSRKQVWNQQGVMVAPVNPSLSKGNILTPTLMNGQVVLWSWPLPLVIFSEARDHLLSPAFRLFPSLKVPPRSRFPHTRTERSPRSCSFISLRAFAPAHLESCKRLLLQLGIKQGIITAAAQEKRKS